MQPVLPLATQRDLQCRHCQRFTSCGPVHIVPDGSILCGRCQTFAKPLYRNLAYEALASIYLFCCTYWPKHCSRTLRFNDSFEHEPACPYKSSCSRTFHKPSLIFSSDRKLPSNEQPQYELVPDHVLERLKCVACESYLTYNPIFTGPDGENICHRCVRSNGYPPTFVRNLSYERLARSCIFPCIYKHRGCTVRLVFGRELCMHESECPYGQTHKKLVTKTPSKKGKEKGVIVTHTGHVYATLTPNSIPLFAPPTNNNNNVDNINQELQNALKKKQNPDSQSLDSVTDNISRTSSRAPTREDTVSFNSRDFDFSGYLSERKSSEDSILSNRWSSSNNNNQNQRQEVYPSPTPAGFNKMPYNGYISPSLEQQFPHLFHFPPLVHNNQNQNNGNPVGRGESFRVGNQSIIDEIKLRQKVKRQGSDMGFGNRGKTRDIL